MALRSRFFVMGLLCIMFAPYLAGRLRADIVLMYLGVFYGMIAIRPHHLSRRWYLTLFLSAGFGALSMAMLLANPNLPLMSTGIMWTNLNLVGLAICFGLGFKRLLANGWITLCKGIIICSIPINLIAVLQAEAPTHAANHLIWDNYGGVPSEDAIELGYDSFAEFLAIGAQRYTGIFNGMHALGMFNIIVCAMCVVLAMQRRAHTTLTLVYVGHLSSLVGGVLSMSKTFLFGYFIFLTTLAILIRRLDLLVTALLLGVLLSLGIALFDESGYFERAMEVNLLDTRFGSQGFLREGVEYVFSGWDVLLFGNVLDLHRFPWADSLYLGPLLMGGGVFLLFYLFLPCSLAIMSLRLANASNTPYLMVFVALHITWLVIGLGIPTYQVGRLTPLLIVANVACYFHQVCQKGCAVESASA
jgi:hypothetical protein